MTVIFSSKELKERFLTPSPSPSKHEIPLRHKVAPSVSLYFSAN